MKIINELINTTITGKGDSDKHLMTLFGIAIGSNAKTIIELGVRNGSTTKPLLEAVKLTGGMLHSVDICEQQFNFDESQKNNWVYHESDAIDFLTNWDPEIDIDLIYIDDWHSYEHVKRELEIIDTLVSPSTIIILHDLMYGGTAPFYHCDLTNSAGEQWKNGGPYRAVAELNPQFWEFSTLPWNNGLTILRKKYSSKFKQK